MRKIQDGRHLFSTMKIDDRQYMDSMKVRRTEKMLQLSKVTTPSLYVPIERISFPVIIQEIEE